MLFFMSQEQERVKSETPDLHIPDSANNYAISE